MGQGPGDGHQAAGEGRGQGDLAEVEAAAGEKKLDLGRFDPFGLRVGGIEPVVVPQDSAAREQKPSKKIGQASLDEGFPMTNFGDLRYTAWGGGMPIVYQGEVVGAVGVSGLPEAEDMILAKMGAELIR